MATAPLDSMGAPQAQRSEQYQRNPRLEALLEELGALFAPVEAQVVDGLRAPERPVVLVVGAPRSGTTLLMQWLAQLDLFAYPTNLLARFYRAPYIGARIQQLLTDPAYAYRDELGDLQAAKGGFDSDLGKTRGALAPSEFWYFWRRFFPAADEDWSQPSEHAGLEGRDRFLKELAALERAFARPLAMKAMIANWNLPVLDALLERVVFLHVRRDPLYNAQSLLQARERFFGDRTRWYSFKPPQAAQLEGLDPVEQVVGQVVLTQHAIAQGLSAIACDRRLEVDYEAFCADPRACFATLAERLAGQGFDAPGAYAGPESFAVSNAWRLGAAERARAEAAIRSFAG